MNSVAVVVLNYKGIEDTIECLASLAKQTHQQFTIVAIDNNSEDGSVEEFKKLEKQYGNKLHTIYNDKNYGFTGGVNTGIKWATENDFDYVALFNNDAVADKKWLESLLNTAKERNAGIVTSLLLHRDGKTIDSTGDWYSSWGLPFPRARNEPTAKAPAAGPIFGASGGASLYSIPMFQKIGIFDDTFFAYYEDVDVSFRAQLAGYQVYYEPAAIAYHKQGATSDRMPGGFTVFQTFKNFPLLFIKNVPASLLVHVGLRLWLAYTLMFGRAVVRGRGWPALKGYLASVWLFWTSALPKRRVIQSSKVVSDDYIKKLLWNDLPPDQTGLRKVRNLFGKKSD
jgi:GT2 family glycosyltransferase